MKKWYSSKLLIFLLLLGIIIPHEFYGNTIEALAAQTGTVTASTLNVRSEPSTTASKVQVDDTNVFLNKGETVNILKEDGDWYYISLLFNGKTVKGYVLSDYVKVTPTPTPKPTVTPKPTKVPTVTPKPVNTINFKKDVKLKASVNADTLNVRSGPGTTYSKVAGLTKGSAVTVYNEVIIDDATKWYGISFKSDGVTKTGYVLSLYIKLDFKNTIKGKVAVSKLKFHSAAGSKTSYIKDANGNIIYLKEDKAVTIIDEVILENEKWFKVSFTLSGKKKVGYTQANQILFRTVNVTPTVAPTVAPTASPTPIVKPSPTPMTTPNATVAPTPTAMPSSAPRPTPKATVAPTAKPSSAPKPTPKATVAPSPTITMIPTSTVAPSPTQGPVILEVSDNAIYSDINWRSGYVCNTIYLDIVANIFANETLLVDYNLQPVVLNNGQKVTVVSAISVDNKIWYHINFTYYWQELSGYVKSEYIYVGEELPVSQGTPTISWAPTPSPTPTPVISDPYNLDFESKLSLEGFPESYKDSLRQLHMLYPKWNFKAYHTGLDWSTIINEESIPGKNLLPNNKSVEWKSLETGAYNWKTDIFTVYDGSTWVTASKDAIKYYMDPRNWLTANYVFQFELLRYQKDYQNIAGVENILKGTALYNSYYTFIDEFGVEQRYSYAETFIKAAEYSGVSPYHLASRVKQEVVTGATTLSNSVSGIYAGFEGLFNFYNIGANDSAGGGAIANGLRYARNGSSNGVNNGLYLIPWTNPYRSIVGGSFFLGNSYINRGQDTVYLQKFNVTNISTYFHQYMTNVEAPWAEGRKIFSAYSSLADSDIVFSIPVYLNMPAQAVSAPKTMFNPNNWLKSLKVLDINGAEFTITPTFSQTDKNYDLIVSNDVEIVEIKAATVSKKAVLGGGGYSTLNVGANTITVPVIAENGDVANYIINIFREQ